MYNIDCAVYKVVDADTLLGSAKNVVGETEIRSDDVRDGKTDLSPVSADPIGVFDE